MEKANRPPVVWVTGGAGYIGANVVRALNAHGFQPIVIDDLSTGSRMLLPTRVPVVVADVTLLDHLEKELEPVVAEYGGPRVVIHLAAEKNAKFCENNPEMAYDTNVNSTYNVVSLANHYTGQSNVHVILASSAAVYGDIHPKRPVKVNNPFSEPCSVYGKSKLAAENLLRDFFTGNRITVLRLFNVAGAGGHPTLNVGPRGSPTSEAESALLPAFTAAHLNKTPFTFRVFSSMFCYDAMVRDFIHVSDVAQIFADMAEYDIFGLNGDRGFTVHNVGRGIPVGTTDLLKLVNYSKEEIEARIEFQLVKRGSEIGYSVAAKPYLLKTGGFKTLGQMWSDEVRWQKSKLHQRIKADQKCKGDLWLRQ